MLHIHLVQMCCLLSSIYCDLIVANEEKKQNRVGKEAYVRPGSLDRLRSHRGGNGDGDGDNRDHGRDRGHGHGRDHIHHRAGAPVACRRWSIHRSHHSESMEASWSRAVWEDIGWHRQLLEISET